MFFLLVSRGVSFTITYITRTTAQMIVWICYFIWMTSYSLVFDMKVVKKIKGELSKEFNTKDSRHAKRILSWKLIAIGLIFAYLYIKLHICLMC